MGSQIYILVSSQPFEILTFLPVWEMHLSGSFGRKQKIDTHSISTDYKYFELNTSQKKFWMKARLCLILGGEDCEI